MEASGDGLRRSVLRERLELQRRLAAWLDGPLSVLGLLMLGLLVIQFFVPLSPDRARELADAQTAIWVVFMVDFLAELALAPSKTRYLRRHWLVAVSVALPALRVVRIVRVATALRGLRLLQTVATLNRGTRAISHIVQRGRLGYALLLTVIVTLTAAAAAYYVEQGAPGATIQTPVDAIWWAATLVTTMNSPLAVVTLEGRAVGLLLRIYALAISGYLTATIAAYLFLGAGHESQSDADQAELRELREEIRRLAQIIERTPSAEPAPADQHARV